MNNGKLYLLPCEIATESHYTFPYLNIVNDLDGMVCEDLRTTRRYLRSVGFKGDFDTWEMYELTGKSTHKEIVEIIGKIEQRNFGVMSEAGCPGIADPGAKLVHLAHQRKVQVVPLSGPSSIVLALMASGLNGQQFTFHGYLPIKEPQKSKTLKSIELTAQKTRYTQIFMETPYRNNQLLQQLLKKLNDETKLCVACDISGTNEFIQMQKIKDWKLEQVDLHKKPCIFILQ